MLFKRIESEGLAHYSYLIGDQNEAVVIDPRRDCDVYVDAAAQAGYQIGTILETHRNEDYLIGSLELAARLNTLTSQPEIWHADRQLDYQYGHPVEPGQRWKVGRLRLEALHTPGHTPGHMSYLLHDPEGHPWMVFTGDALFAGDVGRVDLLGDERMDEMAGMLYETLFHTLLPLGDEILVCPAHGSGSVCGSAISERVWTTLGLERRHNPKLQFSSKEAFVEKITAEKPEFPPYFHRMEQLNIEGPPVLGSLPVPVPLKAPGIAERESNGIVVDTRTEVGFATAHIPGSLSIWQDGLASFAGWFLPYDTPILLVTPTEDSSAAVRTLVRLGYDQVEATLADGMMGWHRAGHESGKIDTVTAPELCRQLDEGQEYWLLDVRAEDELEREGEIRGAQHIHITQLPEHLDEIPKDKVAIFCGTGLRSMVAASILQREGWPTPTVILGGTAGWDSTTCPLELMRDA
jgi:hydroxyacylglutathione hydrolase